MSRIRGEPLRLDELIAEVSHPGAGGIATFLGVVRDVNEGRSVTLLEYEAYGTMAEAELGGSCSEIAAELPGVRVAATHRVGALHVGDVAVEPARRARRTGRGVPRVPPAHRSHQGAPADLEARARAGRPVLGRLEDARCAGEHGREARPTGARTGTREPAGTATGGRRLRAARQAPSAGAGRAGA